MENNRWNLKFGDNWRGIVANINKQHIAKFCKIAKQIVDTKIKKYNNEKWTLLKAKLKIENSKKELRCKEGKNMCKNMSRSGTIYSLLSDGQSSHWFNTNTMMQHHNKTKQ
jgi:hypothetical protein